MNNSGIKTRSASADVIAKLNSKGGDGLVLMKDFLYQRTSLHHAAINASTSLNVVSELLKSGGKALLEAKDRNGKVALNFAAQHGKAQEDKFKLILNKSIDAEVGGEY